jgi:hypothetical protein
MTSKQKEPLQLKRDPLEVGLERYRRPTNSLPAWVLDRGPAAVIGVLLLIVLGPLWALKGYFGIGEQPAVGPTARLTVVSEPLKVWAQGSERQLQSVRVTVANSGQSQADNVNVVVRIRDKEFPLSGPATVPSGKSEVFEGETEMSMRGGDALEVSATCSNCS